MKRRIDGTDYRDSPIRRSGAGVTQSGDYAKKGRLEVDDLYEAPFTNFGMNAIKKLFSKEELEEILQLTKKTYRLK